MRRYEGYARSEIANGSENRTLRLSLAAAAAIQGKKADAYRWLRGAAGHRAGHVYWHLILDPRFESLRGEPEFEAFTAEMKADMEAMRRRVLSEQS